MRVVKGSPIFKADKFDNIRDLILTSCEKNAERDAFIFRRNPKESEIHRSFDEFGRALKGLSTYLLNTKYAGDKLAVVGENCYEWYISYISILSTDSIGVPLDRALPEDELVSLLERSESKILFYAPKHHAMAKSIAAKMKAGENKVVVEKFVCMYPDSVKDFEKDDMFYDLYELIAEGTKLLEAGDTKLADTKIDSEAMRIILFTSGTTSMSKGVMLSHKNIVSNVYAITQTLYVTAGDRAYVILPLHHTFENTCDLFMLSLGACMCLSDGLRYITKNLCEWHPEVAISVPLLYENIYQKIEEGIKASGKEKLINFMIPITNFLLKLKIDIRRAVYKEILDKIGGDLRMVVIGGAGIDKKFVDAFTNFGLQFFQGYGLTETAPVISVTNERVNVHGSVGQPMVGIEAAIDTESTAKNASGEIITKSDCVMLGYYHNEEATKEVIDDNGWFHTGDVGYIDKKGCIHVTGRVKSMIVLNNGKKAFPEEIESLLNEIPGVKESFVWGYHNDRDAVEICAKLLIDREALGRAMDVSGALTDTQIGEYLDEQMKMVNHKMPSYKIVRNFVFSETDLIKTTTLKIRRPKEQAAIEDALKAGNTNMRDMNLKNLDLIVSK